MGEAPGDDRDPTVSYRGSVPHPSAPRVITVVGPTAAGMGRAAADMLIRRLEGNRGEASQILFDGELIVRESSGRPR